MAKRNDEIEALFKLPLTEFIGARKELAARFKKSGLVREAEQVKALAKPPISAWTANQLYFRYRDTFDELIATGQRFRKAQTSGKMVNMREALDARREALLQLSDLATEILRDAGHNPSLDTLRRINTTLEALSAFASSSDGPTPGRLTDDVDPPGFDSFDSFIPSTPSSTPTKRAAEPSQAKPSNKSAAAPAKTKEKTTQNTDVVRREERQARLKAAKALLQEARDTLTAARAAAKSLEAAQKRAEAVTKEAEKQKRQAEERLKKASAAFEEAGQRAQSIALELTDATSALDEAQQIVENATRELETSFRESKNK